MSENPKIDRVMEIVQQMNRAKEAGRTSFDETSESEKGIDLSKELTGVLDKWVLSKGLSSEIAMEAALLTVAVGITKTIEKHPNDLIRASYVDSCLHKLIAHLNNIHEKDRFIVILGAIPT